jgi:hypothetical protein
MQVALIGTPVFLLSSFKKERLNAFNKHRFFKAGQQGVLF